MRFLVKRTARALVTLWVALSLAFAIIRFLPGNPLDIYRGEMAMQCQSCTSEQLDQRVAEYAEQLGLNYEAPLHVQYLDYVLGIFQGDLGRSVSQDGQEVAKIVGEALPWTLFVMTTATVLVFAIAIVWGAVVAYKEGGLFDSVSSSISILSSAIPNYILAFFLILVLGYRLGWFPTQFTTGRSVNWGETGRVTFLLDAMYHAILPIASVVLVQAGTWVLSMRGNSIQVLGEDYVRVARLRGLADRRIATRYVARNAILPMYTGFLTLIGYNLAASVILEQVFTYRGIGWYMFIGLEEGDYSLIMGTFIVYAVALVVAVWIADLTYSYIDPRVKSGGASEAY